MSPSEFRDWWGLIGPLFNSVAILVLGFWLNSRAASRKQLIEQVHKEIEAMGKQIADGNEECRGDIRAIVVQVSAFQLEVAQRYPLRQQVETAIGDLRNDMRFYLGNRSQGQDDPPRRR